MIAAHISSASIVSGETRIIPSISLLERYDSNVWFGFTPPGRKQFDYATNVTPQLTVEHRGRLLEGTFNGGPVAEFYVNNPDLNYVGATGFFNFKLDQLVQKLDRRLSLLVNDTFFYTNQLQAFVNPPAGQTPTIIGSSIGSGIQASRVTTTANNARITGSFLLTPSTSLQASYINTLIRFSGGAVGGQNQAAVFGVTSHSLTAGPQWQITPRDNVGVNYTQSTSTFQQPGGIGGGQFTTQGGLLTWSRLLTATLTANVQGGIQILNAGDIPAGTGQTSGLASNLVYVTNASLLWKYEQNTALTLAYSRAVTPSYFIVPVPLISNVVTASFSYRLTEKLSAFAFANYAHNEDEAAVISFVSYSGTIGVSYSITRSMTASANYTYFNSNFDDSTTGSTFAFDRNAVMVSIKALWN